MVTDAAALPSLATFVSSPAPTAGAAAISPLLVGESSAATHLRAKVQRVAPHFRAAVLSGEEGCGDLEVARTLHQLSPVNGLPFVVLPTAEAERAFAGRDAVLRRPPMEGLLYLPEAARLSRTAQIGLLALLRGAGHSPGRNGIGRGAVRVVAFASHGLRPLVSAGAFSADLAVLLESIRVALPPLRERVEDLPALLGYVAQTIAHELDAPLPEFSAAFLTAAQRLTWPGNLMQMRAVMRLLLQRGSGADECVQASDLAAALEALAKAQTGASPGPRLVRLEQVAQEHIRAVLIGCGGNKLRAAEVLGISRSTLYRMLETPGRPIDWQMAG